jgi:hypothetical protein
MDYLRAMMSIPPRGELWGWDWWLLAPFMAGHVLTAAAFLHIPWTLWHIAAGRRGKWLTRDVAVAGAALVMCGAGHLIAGVLLVFWGLYPVAVFWDFSTGVVSWVFAFRLRRKMRAIIEAPDVSETLKLKDFWERRLKDLDAHPLATRPTDPEVVAQIQRTIIMLDKALVETGVTV